LVRALFAVRYQDVMCPFRLLRRAVFARLPIQSDGPFAHAEVLAKANFLGCVMGEELPLDVRPPPYRGDARQMWRELKQLLRAPDFGPPTLPGTRGVGGRNVPHPLGKSDAPPIADQG
jgi:hypothetical protein